MTESTPTKHCKGCSCDLPLTPQNWKRKVYKGKLASWNYRCRPCQRAIDKGVAVGRYIRNPVPRDYKYGQRDREPGPKPCGTCADLAHRVEGIRCAECKLKRMSEPPPRLEDYMYRHFERVCV